MKSFCIDWDEFKDTRLCNAWVATAIVGAGALGAGATIFGANKAAEAQTNAANQAAATARQAQDYTQQNFNTTRQSLSPFIAGGTNALSTIQNDPAYSSIDKFNTPFTPPTDEASLEATPGYQFTKTQGLKAVQNSAAARGLGVSGAALKGAATFATGLADNTYQANYDRALNSWKTSLDAFNTNLASKNAAFSRLKGLIDTGENAGAGTGVIGATAANTNTTAAGQVGSAQISAGNAQGASYNLGAGAVANAANNLSGYATYKGLYGSGGSDGPTVSSTPSAGNSIYYGDPTVPGFVGP